MGSTIVNSSNWEVMEAADDKEVSENNVSTKKNISTVTSTNNMTKGVQLILCSLLGISTAAGITISRWILLETGEVLLLFANNNNEPVEDDFSVCENYYTSDSDLTSTCTTQDYNHQNISLSKQIGELLQTIASSPNLRCIPIIILLISSTTLIIGIISTRQTIQYYFEKLYTKQNELKQILNKQIDYTVQYMDNLVLDDMLHKITKVGKTSLGLWSGLLLYSLPDELFTTSSSMNNNAKNTRRRLVNATDPNMVHTLFTQGGIWDIVPIQLKDVLIKNSSMSRSGGGVQRLQLTNSSDEEEGTDTTYSMESNEGSSASPTASLPVPIQIIHAKSNHNGEENTTSATNNQGSNESIADVLSATINDLIVFNITGGGSTRHESNVQASQQQGTQGEDPQEEEEDPPKFQLDKVLHHTSIAATFLFMFHLRSSPSTRRAWGSAVKVLMSLGLVSTAVGAGVASSMLSSSKHSTTGNTNPLVAMLYSKVMDQLRIPKALPIMTSLGSRIQWLQEQVRKNDKLKTVVALLVFYGMRRYTRRGGKRQQIMSKRR